MTNFEIATIAVVLAALVFHHGAYLIGKFLFCHGLALARAIEVYKRDFVHLWRNN